MVVTPTMIIFGPVLRACWLAKHHQLYSDMGDDIVMQSISLLITFTYHHDTAHGQRHRLTVALPSNRLSSVPPPSAEGVRCNTTLILRMVGLSLVPQFVNENPD